MNTPHAYELLYELSGDQLLDPRWLAAGAALLVLALLAWWRCARRGRGVGLARFFAVAAVLMMAALTGSAWEEGELARSLHAGQAVVVEGELRDHEVVERTRYQRRNHRHVRSVSETFRVGGVAFGFVRGVTSPGFNNGGDRPIRLSPGDRLRVHYVATTPGDTGRRHIVRLEREPAPPVASLADAAAAAPVRRR